MNLVGNALDDQYLPLQTASSNNLQKTLREVCVKTNIINHSIFGGANDKGGEINLDDDFWGNNDALSVSPKKNKKATDDIFEDFDFSGKDKKVKPCGNFMDKQPPKTEANFNKPSNNYIGGDSDKIMELEKQLEYEKSKSNDLKMSLTRKNTTGVKLNANNGTNFTTLGDIDVSELEFGHKIAQGNFFKTAWGKQQKVDTV